MACRSRQHKAITLSSFSEPQTMQIHDAIEAGNLTKVAQILDDDPTQIESISDLGNRPLHEAVRLGRPPIVRLLLERGANASTPGHHGNTPLHYAALEDAVDIANQLLEHNADLETKDHEGYTPLQIACRTAPQVAEALVRHGAKVDLNSAIRLQDIDRARRLLASGDGLGSVSSFPDRLLEDGLFSRNEAILDLLLQTNQHPSPLDLANSESLLFRAIEQAMAECNLTFVAKLLNHGVSPVVRNQRGQSPLAYLSQFRTGGGNPSQSQVKQDLVRLLKQHGATA